jgi:hypothetical protein
LNYAQEHCTPFSKIVIIRLCENNRSFLRGGRKEIITAANQKQKYRIAHRTISGAGYHDRL